MATETTNYKFKKPDTTDFYNIADQNGNWEECDKQLKVLDDGKAAVTHEHTKAEITDLPTRLPADGGNADTVGGKAPSSFAVNVRLSNGDDLNNCIAPGFYSAISDSIAPNILNRPFDYAFGIAVLEHGKNTQIAVSYRGDVPKIRINHWGTGWGTWGDLPCGDAKTLGGLTKDNFVQFLNGAAFIKKQSTVKEGGQLGFQRADDSTLTIDPYIDLFENGFRLVCADANGTKVTNIPINEPKTAESTVAIFTSGTADKTPGVSNLGKDQIYIMYE